MVSVPCRGAMFLNLTEHDQQHRTALFPSPVGELCFSIFFAGGTVGMIWFPSPVGELCFSITESDSQMYHRRRFPSPVGELCFSIDTKTVGEWEHWFPSPVGELCFSIRADDNHAPPVSVSVPCRGAMFLNTIPAIPLPV